MEAAGSKIRQKNVRLSGGEGSRAHYINGTSEPEAQGTLWPSKSGLHLSGDRCLLDFRVKGIANRISSRAYLGCFRNRTLRSESRIPLKTRRFDCLAFLRASETSQTNHLGSTLCGEALNDVPEPSSTSPSSVHVTAASLRSASVSGTRVQCCLQGQENNGQKSHPKRPFGPRSTSSCSKFGQKD